MKFVYFIRVAFLMFSLFSHVPSIGAEIGHWESMF